MSLPFDRIADLIAEQGGDALSVALRGGGRTAGLFAEESLVRSFSQRIHRGRSSDHHDRHHIAGAGIHVFDAETSAYAATEELSPAGLHAAAEEVAGSFDSGMITRVAPFVTKNEPANLPADTLEFASETEARSLLRRASDAALSLLPDVEDVESVLQGRTRRILVASSDGRLGRSAESRVTLRVKLKYRDGAETYAVGGGVGGLGVFAEHRPEDVAMEAAERLKMLSASEMNRSLAGEMPVVIAGGWGGVWLHEVLGHALEADVCSFASDRLGERVAGAHVTVIDGPNAAGNIDDEGSPVRRTVLLEDGVLNAFLTDRVSAFRRGLPESGNGRRQDYRHPPLPRMTNLMLKPGDAAPDDLLHEIGRGLFVKMVGGGRVSPTKDTFSFEVLEGYMIEDGRMGSPISGVRVEGRSSEVLRGIIGIGSDFRVDHGRGICEKRGQVVPVSVGMPTILVESMSVSPGS